MGNRYNKLEIKMPMEFGYIFNQLCRVGYKRTLSQCSRDEIVRLAIILHNEYCNKTAVHLCKILSHNDIRLKKIYHKINNFYSSKTTTGITYVAALDNMPIELLRKAFSIQYKKFNNNTHDVKKLNYHILKLITQINEELMIYKIEEKDKNLAALAYLNSASSYDILHFENKNEFTYQLIQAVRFFEYIETNDKYSMLLELFYKKYEIKSWREYIRTIFSIAIMTSEKSGIIPKNLCFDVDSLITQSVLDKISIPSNIDRIPYKSKDEFDKEGNSDYRIFRDKPLFILENGDYAIHTPIFLIDRLYSGLYFDFINIAKEMNNKTPDISNLFTSNFMEKKLFGESLKKCISTQYKALDEDALKKIYNPKNNELGCPDFILQKEESIILFECKDIRLNAWIKGKRDYKVIEQELRNKLVSKTFKLDPLNKSHISIKPKKIGCGQIAGHLANIRNKKFPWDTSISQNTIVYPVLIIADNRLLAEGLSVILHNWYAECLKNEGLNIYAEKRLILMSPLTLIKYEKRFKKDSFEKYFDEYYKEIQQNPIDTLSAITHLISFDEYMAQYSYNINELSEEMKQAIIADRKEFNNI